MSNRGLRSGFIGTPQMVIDRVAEFEKVGVSLLLLSAARSSKRWNASRRRVFGEWFSQQTDTIAQFPMLGKRGTRMTSSKRISEVFDRLIKQPRLPFEELPFADQVVYCSIVARCEKDQACFFSIFEQALTDDQIEVYIRGLRRMNQAELAEAFERSLQILRDHNFYPRDKKRLPESVYQEIENEVEEIGRRVGDLLWDLDDDLVKLLNEQ